MAFKRDDRSSGELNGFLDSGSRMTGDLHFEDTFRIDGRLDGRIESEGHLVIGEKGEVEGDVQVGHIHVAGTIRGTIVGAQKLEVASTGRIYGEIHTRSLVVHDGAVLEGSCSMAPSEASIDVDRQPKAVEKAS